MLFCAILTYAVSGWMIEFAFRAIFFVTVGMISAFHRILMDRTPSYSPEKDASSREEWGGIAGIKNSKLASAGATPEFVPAMTAQDYVLQRKAVRGAVGRPRQFLAAQTGLAVATAGASVPTGYVAPVKDETGTYSPDLSGLGAYLGWVRFRWYDIGGVYLSFRLALYLRDYAISL